MEISLKLLVAAGLLFGAHLARAASPGKKLKIPQQALLWALPKHPFVGTVKLMNVLETREATLSQSPQGDVVAYSCDRDAPATDFLSMEVYNAPPPDNLPKVTVDLLRQPATGINDLFNVLRHTRLGRAVLHKFLPRYGTEVPIRHMTEAERQAVIRAKGFVPEAFYKIAEKTIYVDKTQERGLVAFVLLHEIIHAQDRESHQGIDRITKMAKQFDDDMIRTVNGTALRLGKRAADLVETEYLKEDIDRLQRRLVMLRQAVDINNFRAERLAHDSSFNVWKELAQVFPEYYDKETESDPMERILRLRRPADVKTLRDSPWYLTDEKLAEFYNLNLAYINKFKAGRCRILNLQEF